MSSRQAARLTRRARLYAAKMAAARTPAERAAVEYDALRARLDDMPDTEAEWAQVADLLAGMFTRELHSPYSPDAGGQRTAARGRARDNHDLLAGSKV